MPIRTGRHFLQIPGPTNVPDQVLRAMDFPTMDHRGPEFAVLAKECLENLKPAFQTRGPVVIFPSSGTGAAEAALVNTLSPGDRVLIMETGWFSHVAWLHPAEKLGLQVEYVAGSWRRGIDPQVLEAKLAEDTQHAIKAVVAVHNETSTGVTSRIGEVRKAMDRAKHPALLIVDTISSLGSIDFRHDEWEVDVTVAGSQKGLMLPPGIAFNAISDKAIAASKTATLPRAYWDWDQMLKSNATGFFPYTPATNILYGLREALRMLTEEGWPNVFHRHARYGDATRAAVRAWGLELQCEDAREYSNSLTAILMPSGHNADLLRKVILEKFDMSLGAGLGKVAGTLFPIGHLGAFNDLTLIGTLGGVEMGLGLAGVPHKAGGVAAAMAELATSVAQPAAVSS